MDSPVISELNWLEHYWKEMSTDFQKLELNGSWLEPIKDAAHQAECILQQILYPGVDGPNVATWEDTDQSMETLDEVLKKLKNISRSSQMLIDQLYGSFSRDSPGSYTDSFIFEIDSNNNTDTNANTNTEERYILIEESFGPQEVRREKVPLSENGNDSVCYKLIKSSDALRCAWTNLLTEVSNMKQIREDLSRCLRNSKNNIAELTSRLSHYYSIAEEIRKIAVKVHNCRKGFLMFCIDRHTVFEKAGMSITLVEFDSGDFQSSDYSVYIDIVNSLVHLVDPLLNALTEFISLRDLFFNNEISKCLTEMMQLEEQPLEIQAISSEAHSGLHSASCSKDEHVLLESDLHYWEQMLSEFEQLELNDFSWLKPIKDGTHQAEIILQQILYRGVDNSNDETSEDTNQPLDTLDEVLKKLKNISTMSGKLIQLYRPFDQDFSDMAIRNIVKESTEEEFDLFDKLINRSDQLEEALTKLRDGTSAMKKFSAKNVKLDVLLRNFKDVTEDRRLYHDHLIWKVMKNMAESIYDCRNAIGLLFVEAERSIMIQFDTSALEKGCRHQRNYIDVLHRLIYLVDKLAVAMAEIKYFRDDLFNNEFLNHLAEIMQMDETTAQISGIVKENSLEQLQGSRLKAFLKDHKVLQQAYNQWKEVIRQNYVVDNFAGVPEEATDVTIEAMLLVEHWDPFDSTSCIGIAEALMRIISVAESRSSLKNTNLQKDATNGILQFASCRLNDLFYCLIDAKFAIHNVETIHANSQHPSRWFCPSSFTSSLSAGERNSSYWSSVSSSRSFSLSSNPVNIPAPNINKQMFTNEIEKTSDGRISDLFSEAISNLKQLANIMIHSKCCYVLDKAFQEATQQVVETNYLTTLGFHQRDRKVVLEDLGLIELSELRKRRRKWEWAFKVVVYEVLPWIKCLCYEIFAKTDKLKEVCFHRYADICLMPLLEFADAATSAMSGRNERIFHQLYVHEVLGELSSNISALLTATAEQVPQIVHSPRWILFLGDVTPVLARLAKAIVRTLADLGRQIQDDKSCSTPNDVDVHQLTCSTMRTVKKLANYQRTLDSILRDKNSLLSGNNSSDNGDVTIGASDCCKLVSSMISCLRSKLEQKSELLKASGAEQVFWINNLNYMVEEGASPQLKIVLGEEWVQGPKKEIHRHLTSFEKSISAEVLPCLTATNKVSARNRLKSFKLAIEEMCQTQASWKVPDPERREELRNAVLETVVPAYTKFLEVHKGKLGPRVIEKELSVAELKSCLLDLFEGSG